MEERRSLKHSAANWSRFSNSGDGPVNFEISILANLLNKLVELFVCELIAISPLKSPSVKIIHEIGNFRVRA